MPCLFLLQLWLQFWILFLEWGRVLRFSIILLPEFEIYAWGISQLLQLQLLSLK